ncbi:hypothetical protein HanIR_Chr10g0481941 [Helianthus annuus]|nr:hypothetical protein HanIR_Chr10g0481941 [Helianthus annuus]
MIIRLVLYFWFFVLGNTWWPQICLDLFLLVVLLASCVETLT